MDGCAVCTIQDSSWPRKKKMVIHGRTDGWDELTKVNVENLFKKKWPAQASA